MNALISPLALLALPFLAALVAVPVTRLLKHHAGWVLALFPLAIFVVLAGYIDDVANGAVITAWRDWVPSLSVRFSVRIDGLSLVFALLISGIGALIVLYSGAYLKDDPGQGRFFAFIMAFMGSMLGVVLSDDFIMFFIFWELTSITSFLLIGYNQTSQAARRAALQALAVTGGGGLVLLAGLLILIDITGFRDFSGMFVKMTGITAPGFMLPLSLIIIGAFTKSAQFPFHVWLPNAMQAPTPVSAYLHSATMVKAGVYLLMRLHPVFGAMPEWQVILPLFGAITLLFGAVTALRQTDLKLMLAHTTLASLGLLVMLTGFGTQKAIEAAVLYLIAHALFKGALFMVAGVIDHETGARDIIRLGGLGRAMPVTFFMALLAAFSMGGLPLFFGFQAKEEIYGALASSDIGSLAMLAASLAGNALMFAIAFAVGLKPFIGPVAKTPKPAHDGPLALMLGPLLLAMAGIGLVLMSGWTHHNITSPMASAIWGKPVMMTMTAMPHWGLSLALSMVTIALGAIAYRLLGVFHRAISAIETTIGWAPDRGFDQLMGGLVRLSAKSTRILQPGRLEIYLTVTFAVVAIVLVGVPSWAGQWPQWPRIWPALTFYESAFLAILVIGLAQVILARTRLVAIVSLGIQGFAVAMLYLLFGAPDLSFTQFMVEILSVVILALVMTRLRLEPTDHRPLPGRIGDGVIALVCGFGFMSLLVKTMETPFDATLSHFFNQFSKTMAHGSNVVNVIIVDFRGTDTLGEIAVVVITGVAILALVRLRPAVAHVADNNPDMEDSR